MHCLTNVFLVGLIGVFRASCGGRGAIPYCISGEEIQSTGDATSTQVNQTESPPELLMLPSSVGVTGEINRQINLGEKISLEELGPIIINADGTTRRITNWATLSEAEQAQSWRLISARNLKRLKAMQKKQAEENPIEDKTDETQVVGASNSLPEADE